MSLQIAKPGILDTIQDQGRTGYAKWGINPGGAADGYASRMANALVGNDAGESVLEMHFPAPEIVFRADTLLAITGADFSPHINSKPVATWKPLIVAENSVLTFPRRSQGCRCYLSVHGGFDVMPWLGSRSTNLKISMGGMEGRRLEKNDVLAIRSGRFPINAGSAVRELPWRVDTGTVYQDKEALALTEGAEHHDLDEDAKAYLWSHAFRVSSVSDRMALYLQHEPLAVLRRKELLSSAVSPGTIQLLPDGHLLILASDHQTTGGYPRIGHVASAHLPALAQRSANEVIRFRKVTAVESENMLLSLRQQMHALQRACLDRLARYYADH